MPKFTGVTLQTLNERLGREYSRGTSRSCDLHRHAFRMVWKCTCLATAEARDEPMPANLTPWEQELFENAPFPEKGWNVRPCLQHQSDFTDHPEEPD